MRKLDIYLSSNENVWVLERRLCLTSEETFVPLGLLCIIPVFMFSRYYNSICISYVSIMLVSFLQVWYLYLTCIYCTTIYILNLYIIPVCTAYMHVYTMLVLKVRYTTMKSDQKFLLHLLFDNLPSFFSKTAYGRFYFNFRSPQFP